MTTETFKCEGCIECADIPCEVTVKARNNPNDPSESPPISCLYNNDLREFTLVKPNIPLYNKDLESTNPLE